MNDTTSGFGKLVPGFDFLQGLAKGAAGNIPQLPNLSNWVAPTLNVDELDKRLEELKAVHFWLDQNAKALGAVIQALEVQKMTLATLKGMNFNMGDVANALKLKAADTVVSSVHKVGERVTEGASALGARLEADPPKAGPRGGKTKAKAGAGGLVDPMQWWGSLTQQFQTIANNALKDATRQTGVDATRNLATGLAKETIKATSTAARRATQGTGAKAAPKKSRSSGSAARRGSGTR
jgi:hypothetical protein